MDFEAWYAYTAEREAKQKEEAEEAAAAEEADRQARKARDVIAFQGWVNEVSIHDTALEVSRSAFYGQGDCEQLRTLSSRS